MSIKGFDVRRSSFKKVSSHCGRHDIILCLQRIGFNLLNGMTLGIEYDIVRAEVERLAFMPFSGWSGRAMEGRRRDSERRCEGIKGVE